MAEQNRATGEATESNLWTRRSPAPPRAAVGALAIAALAIAALAVGAVAIGTLAVRRMTVRRFHGNRIHIDELDIGRLRVRELAQPKSEAAGDPQYGNARRSSRPRGRMSAARI